MTAKIEPIETKWACEQIDAYRQQHKTYETYAQVLSEVLRGAAHRLAPLAIVEARPKRIASFAEKIQRKKEKYRDPVNQLTDLCGGRVITHTSAEVEPICRFIEQHFIVDAANSVKISERLRPNEFGYRSVHYVVQFRRNVFPNADIRVAIPDDLYPDPSGQPPMKAEIQVRTLLEHAWAVFSHERVYKGTFSVPDVWQRELAGLAAMLEEADQAFARIQTGLRAYAASYGAYMDPDRIRKEIALLQVVRNCEADNLEVAHRIAKLAMTIEDWDLAIEMLQPHVKSQSQPILRDLGIALCKKHAKIPECDDFALGQRYLEQACELDPTDADAWASRAGTYRSDPNTQRDYYRRAYATDPTDPYALSRLLVSEIIHAGNLDAIGLLEPSLRASMQRCRSQIAVGVNMPWAYYSLGMFHLLLHEPNESLVAYAKAVQLSTATWMLETSLRTLQELACVQDSLPDYDWLVKWLIINWRARFPDAALPEALVGQLREGHKPIAGPVLIIAGGTDPNVESEIQAYRELLLSGLRDYAGTIISGGTRAGVAGLVGAVQEDSDKQAAAAVPAAACGRLRTIGYVPKTVPFGIERDARYQEIRITGGHDFSALEVIQYWIDILLSGIRPQEVSLIGINGGAISAVEYRLALALGAQVIIIEGSGRAADGLLKDRDWAEGSNLLPVPADAAALAAVLGAPKSIDDAPRRDTLGRAVHEAYRRQQAGRLAEQDPVMADWESLAQNLQDSNRQQADHIEKKLARIGCAICQAGQAANPVTEFSADEVEIMAEMEHGRWIAERLKDGWRYGLEKDVARKISPYLVSWRDLADSVREWDRNTVRKIPEFLAGVGLQVQREVPRREPAIIGAS